MSPPAVKHFNEAVLNTNTIILNSFNQIAIKAQVDANGFPLVGARHNFIAENLE